MNEEHKLNLKTNNSIDNDDSTGRKERENKNRMDQKNGVIRLAIDPKKKYENDKKKMYFDGNLY